MAAGQLKSGRMALALIGAASIAAAGDADVVGVTASCSADRVCRFSVTVRHDDAGWEHYADRWEIHSLDGKVLGIRELAHPHDHEQPFTRSLEGIRIPDGITEVRVRARDSRHRYGGEGLVYDLESGETRRE